MKKWELLLHADAFTEILRYFDKLSEVSSSAGGGNDVGVASSYLRFSPHDDFVTGFHPH